jgi:hypothetical protein
MQRSHERLKIIRNSKERTFNLLSRSFRHVDIILATNDITIVISQRIHGFHSARRR